MIFLHFFHPLELKTLIRKRKRLNFLLGFVPLAILAAVIFHDTNCLDDSTQLLAAPNATDLKLPLKPCSASSLPSLIFVSAVLGLLPLATMIGDMTEELAAHLGATTGALIMVTFGNITELIISLAALRHAEYNLIQLSLVGSVMGNLLMVLGGALFTAALAVSHRFHRIHSAPEPGTIEETERRQPFFSFINSTFLKWIFDENDDVIAEAHNIEMQTMKSPRRVANKEMNRTMVFVHYSLDGAKAFSSAILVTTVILAVPSFLAFFWYQHGKETTIISNNGTLMLYDVLPDMNVLGSTLETPLPLRLSRHLAVVVVLLYILFLFFQLGTHRAAFDDDSGCEEVEKKLNNVFDDLPIPGKASIDGESMDYDDSDYNSSEVLNHSQETDIQRKDIRNHRKTYCSKSRKSSKKSQKRMTPQFSFRFSIIVLGVATMLVAVVSELLVTALTSGGSEGLGLGHMLSCLVVVPIAGNLAGHVTALMLAARGRTVIAVGLALGSALQVASLTFPAVVIAAWIVDKPLGLLLLLRENHTSKKKRSPFLRSGFNKEYESRKVIGTLFNETTLVYSYYLSKNGILLLGDSKSNFIDYTSNKLQSKFPHNYGLALFISISLVATAAVAHVVCTAGRRTWFSGATLFAFYLCLIVIFAHLD